MKEINKIIIRQAWINREEKIISFHFVEGYVKENITNDEEFLRFIKWYTKQGYKFQ